MEMAMAVGTFIGAEGTAAAIIGGAIVGAAASAGMAALTGGNIGKSALIGGLVGGAAAGFGAAAGGASEAATAAEAASGNVAAGSANLGITNGTIGEAMTTGNLAGEASFVEGAKNFGVKMPELANSATSATGTTVGTAVEAGSNAVKSGGLMAWLDAHPTAAIMGGSSLSSVGQALTTGLGKQDDIEAAKELADRKFVKSIPSISIPTASFAQMPGANTSYVRRTTRPFTYGATA